jgi:hypothetical protein
VGVGIKKTNAYTSRLSRKEWVKKREEFWETRTEGKPPCWQAIKLASEQDEGNLSFISKSKKGNALAILAAAELKLVSKSF